jgi:hypothetical protein
MFLLPHAKRPDKNRLQIEQLIIITLDLAMAEGILSSY